MKPEREIYKRENWPAGPWDAEGPEDRIEWRHKGVPCLMVRNLMGAWCGYAAVGPDHPWHGKDYSHEDVNVDVHGGLTFADKCQEGGKICHVAQPGEPDPVWWFGFDTAHSGDRVPGMAALEKEMYEKAKAAWPCGAETAAMTPTEISTTFAARLSSLPISYSPTRRSQREDAGSV